jgi:polysaccharide export outer membrane protein
VLLDRRDQIYPSADLGHAYLARRNPDEVIPVDVERLLFAYTPQDDIVLRAYDHLIIPFRRFSVAVTGAVRLPGVYPYVPNKTFQYYLDLAGGIDPERGRIGSVKVFDRTGRQLPSDAMLDPEGKVYAPYSFSFYFFKYFPIVASASLAVLTGLYYIDQINQ